MTRQSKGKQTGQNGHDKTKQTKQKRQIKVYKTDVNIHFDVDLYMAAFIWGGGGVVDY